MGLGQSPACPFQFRQSPTCDPVNLAFPIHVVEANMVAVSGVRVCGPHHLGHGRAAASDGYEEKTSLVRVENAVEMPAQLFGRDAFVIEEDEAFARPKPLEYRHGLVERDKGCRIPPGPAGDDWICKRHEQPVAYRADLCGSFYCQGLEILADENLKCLRRICRTKTDKGSCSLADTQISQPAITKACCFD
jgi:hypothetical protein